MSVKEQRSNPDGNGCIAMVIGYIPMFYCNGYWLWLLVMVISYGNG